MDASWLDKYPRAAAMLQQAASGEEADAELEYTLSIDEFSDRYIVPAMAWQIDAVIIGLYAGSRIADARKGKTNTS